MPAVSVIVPVYNPGEFLRGCLDSICGQTLSDIEVICVNDCSTDGSLAVLNEYASGDARIVVIDSKENHGAATSRNIALARARGEFLAFVDSDDTIDSDFLEKLYRRACETGADIVKGERRFYDPVSHETSPDIPYMQKMHKKIRTDKASFVNAFTTAIYKNSLIREHQVRFLDGVVIFEDSYFTIKATIHNLRTEVVDGTYYNYTRNPHSVCSKGLDADFVRHRIQGTEAVMDMLNAGDVSQEHYITVFKYLFLELLALCRNINLPDTVTKLSSEGLMKVIAGCKYPDELLFTYFQEFKKLNRDRLIEQVRGLRSGTVSR